MRERLKNIWVPGTGIRVFALVGWIAALVLAVTK